MEKKLSKDKILIQKLLKENEHLNQIIKEINNFFKLRNKLNNRVKPLETIIGYLSVVFAVGTIITYIFNMASFSFFLGGCIGTTMVHAFEKFVRYKK